MQPDERPPPFAPSSYEPRSPIPPQSISYDETRYTNNTPPPSAPPDFEDEVNDELVQPSAPPYFEDEVNDELVKPSAPPNLMQPSAPPNLMQPSAPPTLMKPSAPPNLIPSAPPESDFNDVATLPNLMKPSNLVPSAPPNLMQPSAPPVPIVALQALQTLQPSAPTTDLEYFQDQVNRIEEETNNLKLALIESELEYILQEISKLTENECDKQCQETIEKIEPNTLEIFLTKTMNDIFKEE